MSVSTIFHAKFAFFRSHIIFQNYGMDIVMYSILVYSVLVYGYSILVCIVYWCV